MSRLLRRAADALSPALHEDGEIVTAAGIGAAMAALSDAERAMIANILRLRDLRVVDVMTPRADIVAVGVDSTLDTVTAAFKEGSLSRLPVFRETLDDPIGFVHLKDLAIAYGLGRAASDEHFDLRKHIRTALFVPPSMRIAALMQKMQGSRIHMALVIDEFGGVDGLVTIEDLVEQIVGDIEDEHDEEEIAHWREESPGVYLIDARADIAEFEEAEGVTLRLPDWEEDVDTLGGLVFMLTGRVPARAEVIAHPAGHEFQIVDADPRRIKRLRLIVQGASQASPAARKAAE
ncbi:hemolysin family protein [Limibaculum sp. FT325]|uniref:hemolysin family protein n=1 Tax=Thermohalobaculum sediminis TaxID=2939436 RepID=UPI0020BE25F2|nr:hemolysin family protein [Limibaculum sediminis]MCL5778324.1 hemolysin family protein [Limibaculum sediminis]